MNPNIDISQNKTLLWLMAIACGLCAGANYYCQPLIASIQQSFQVPQSQVALTVTFAQVSYALGLLFIVPLGDIVNKSKFIPLLMFGAAIGLSICALSNNLTMLWIGTIITGLFSVAAQVLIPLVTLAVRPEKVGQTVGFLMSGLLVGILLSTSMAGLLSNLWHWNVIYIVSAVLMLILAVLLKRQLPVVNTSTLGYTQIFASMAQLLRQERRLVFRALIGGCAFASMSILFSTIAMLLTAPPFSLPDVWVGILTLVGVFGALSTQWIGKWADRGHNLVLTWAGCCILAFSWGLLYLGGQSLISYALGYAIINLGLAMVHSCNQNVIFKLNPNARSRINSIYMTSYFIGGAAGSALGVYAWHHGGWPAACLTGFILVCGASLMALLDQIWQNKRLKAN
ncbi:MULTISPECIES: MFS transporter [Acinetobacter]|uniref:MFS transporter n=1 Tax=Acinetobacter chengduensis TaxID=2420890 RepID=A0ABX9TUN9_9GAMM|nr:MULTISPECIES: MFS transporter [Acinetobacter]RKG40623.1 MFS transporter [Acinetobacter sp. WCHAc060007]RLL21039.1 MFS transporter [Acinetobacter chengduensis]